MKDAWLGFVNEEVSKHPAPLDGMDRARAREQLLERAATSFPFPLEVSFRGVVDDRIEIDGDWHLILEPTALSDHAREVLGGVLVPSERCLYEGSVAEVTCRLADPDRYALDEGVLAVDGDLQAEVPIEP